MKQVNTERQLIYGKSWLGLLEGHVKQVNTETHLW